MKMEPLTQTQRKQMLTCERERSTLNLRCMSTASSLGMVAADGAAQLGTSRSSLDLVGSGTCDDCNGANGSDDKQLDEDGAARLGLEKMDAGLRARTLDAESSMGGRSGEIREMLTKDYCQDRSWIELRSIPGDPSTDPRSILDQWILTEPVFIQRISAFHLLISFRLIQM